MAIRRKWKEIDTGKHNKEKYFWQTIAIKYSSGAQLNQFDNPFNCYEREFQLRARGAIYGSICVVVL